jgi:4-hydroxy-tetrahydrodipicolinate reductase
MIKVGVGGAAGRMGSLIVRGVLESEDLNLVGALEAKEHPFIGRDIGEAIGKIPQGIKITSDIVEAFSDSAVIIDFSTPSATLENIRVAADYSKAMVIGTTGFTDKQRNSLMEYGASIPFVLSPNMSIGVNVLFKIVGILTKLLGEAYDVEIVEAHHRLKKDAPSGTAKGLALAIAKAREVDLEQHARYERYGSIGERPMGEIGIQTVRAGDIVGEHTVYFAGGGERIEITHRAHSRENFARGALRAARWIVHKQPGVYTMMDVLGLLDENR